MQKKTHNGRNYTGERNIKAVCPVNLTTAHIKRKVRSSIQERPARSKTTHDIPLRSIYQRLSWYERYHRYSVTFRDIRRVSFKAPTHRASPQSVAAELGEIALVPYGEKALSGHVGITIERASRPELTKVAPRGAAVALGDSARPRPRVTRQPQVAVLLICLQK